jgi:hypothetical protein
MADSPRTTGKWLWPLLIALLAIILLVWLLNPSGDTEGQVEDPIVTPEFGEPAAPDAQELDVGTDTAAGGTAAENGATTAETDPAAAGQ